MIVLYSNYCSFCATEKSQLVKEEGNEFIIIFSANVTDGYRSLPISVSLSCLGFFSDSISYVYNQSYSLLTSLYNGSIQRCYGYEHSTAREEVNVSTPADSSSDNDGCGDSTKTTTATAGSCYDETTAATATLIVVTGNLTTTAPTDDSRRICSERIFGT